jgi:hypothetical protein
MMNVTCFGALPRFLAMDNDHSNMRAVIPHVLECGDRSRRFCMLNACGDNIRKR